MVNTYDNNDSYHAIDDKDGGIFWSLMPPFTFCLVVLSRWPHYPYSIVEALHCSFSCVFTSCFQLSNRFMLRFDSLITVFFSFTDGTYVDDNQQCWYHYCTIHEATNN